MPFKYVAEAGARIPSSTLHSDLLGDRASKGDPPAYAVPKTEHKKWGNGRR